MPLERLAWDRSFVRLMLSPDERRALARLAPSCRYVMALDELDELDKLQGAGAAGGETPPAPPAAPHAFRLTAPPPDARARRRR